MEIKINAGALTALVLAVGVGFFAGRASAPERPAPAAADAALRAENLRLTALVAASTLQDQVRIRAKTCVSNLKQIDSAKEQWAMDNRKTSVDTPIATDLYGPDKYVKSTPSCPDGGVYTIAAIGTAPICSLGDRNTADPEDDHVLP